MKTTIKILPYIKHLPKVEFCAVASFFTIVNRLVFLVCTLISCSCCLLPFAGSGQSTAVPSGITEQQLEAITENNEDEETEDDSYLQSLKELLKNPVNLNTTDIESLKELTLFTPLQIQYIIRYRKLLGNFISIYELQAVPGLTILFIEKIRPYITVSTSQNLVTSVLKRLNGGTSSLLTRATQVLEMQKGFKVNQASSSNYYPGSRQKLLMRYQYRFKDLLQYGIVGEKDAGEQFFKGAQKKGFDFYALHFFARNMGIIKLLALGDFTVNLGQGLTQWQSLAFKKGADVTNIKRQSAILRPYNSSGEFNFHRGIGITVEKKNITVTTFLSYKNTDVNFIADTVNHTNYISSFQTSGLHRTKSEISDKGVQRQFVAGGNVSYHSNRLYLGINGVRYQFALPVKKSPEPYNIYAIAGRSFGNYSVDYSYTFRNLHFFGEAAITNIFDKAFVNGIIASVDSKVDMSILYRNLSKRYRSLYSNAFTESTNPVNEKGLYAAINIRPNTFWRLDAYVDFYQSAWLKYRVDAPSAGNDFLVQATYRPKKQLEMYVRYRTASKAKNYNSSYSLLSTVQPRPIQNLRAHFSYQLNRSIAIRNRVEMSWFDKRGASAENGFLTLVDLVVQPMMKRYAGSIRLQYFETDGYESRLYAYENDVLYSFSIPVFFDMGYRYYINLNYDVSKKLILWLRCAQTIFNGKAFIGSGLDEITGNKRTELKVQVQYLF